MVNKVSRYQGVPFEETDIAEAFDAGDDSRAVQLLSSMVGVQAFGGGGTSPYSLFGSGTLDGDKFFGGFGGSGITYIDYWTLRRRSAQLFEENLYARGLLRRLITNEINTGLTPEVSPNEKVLGVGADSLAEWSREVESRFEIWASDPKSCDWRHRDTFGALQREARLEALINGDVLIYLRRSGQTGLPTIELISGDLVQNPLDSKDKARPGNKIQLGVETDLVGRVQAHWVRQDDGTTRRVPAFGSRSGKRISWLLYGTDKRLDALRGQPALALILQSLKEIDRYRDSVQRKAVITSLYAMFMTKDEDKVGSDAFQRSAIRRDAVTSQSTDGAQRDFGALGQLPGIYIDELQHGETPHAFNATGTDEKFGDFEAAILHGIAWSFEIPPEILTLAFSNNYSASQAAINEFKIYLNKVWAQFGDDFCTPIYREWLVSKTLSGEIESPGFVEALSSPRRADDFGAWIRVYWYGSIKPSTDMLKQGKGSEILVANGWSSNAREARALTGTSYDDNIERLRRENIQKAEALRPMLELKAEFGPDAVTAAADELPQLSVVENDEN